MRGVGVGGGVNLRGRGEIDPAMNDGFGSVKG
jgi:hypothetical protein